MIDHVTYQLTPGSLHDPSLEQMLRLIGLIELDNPALRDTKEAGYDVRWFAYQRPSSIPPYPPDTIVRATLHLVADPVLGGPLNLGLGHFAVRVGRDRYNVARLSEWCTRDSGSGRVWLEGFGLRIEVRP